MEDADSYFMGLALDEAQIAFDKGEVPVGAILVKEGRVIARAHNSRESSGDPTAHAEVLAMRAGAEGGQAGDGWRLMETTLYVTKEPCIMCAGTMLNARLSRLVFGCRDVKGGAVESLYKLLSDGRLNHRVEVLSGVREDECARLLKSFFQSRRGG